METLHNQELVATILEDNVASELTTIQDFLRWTYSTFNRSDIYYGQGHDNAWDESLQLVLAGLQLPLDLPQDLFSSKLTPSEKETLVHEAQNLNTNYVKQTCERIEQLEKELLIHETYKYTLEGILKMED